MILHGGTKISFLYRKYRIAFAIDVSPSMFVLDAASGSVPFSNLPASIESMLRSLLQPMVMCSPSACDTFFPEIYVSVMARAAESHPVLSSVSSRFLVHGFLLSNASIDALLRELAAGLATMEMEVAQCMERSAAGGSGVSGFASPTSPHSHVSLPRVLEPALFALKLLPQDACPIVVVVTDGTRALALSAPSRAPVRTTLLPLWCCRCHGHAVRRAVRQHADAAATS